MPSKTKKRRKKCPAGQKWTKLPIPADAPPGTQAKYGCKIIKGIADDKDPNDPRNRKPRVKIDKGEAPKDPNKPTTPKMRD